MADVVVMRQVGRDLVLRVPAVRAALLDGADTEDAAWLASSATALTVRHAGGRPQLDRGRLAAAAREHRR